MTSCKNLPPPEKGWKCLDCWQCSHLPGSKTGTCLRVASTGPDKNMTSCEAAEPNLFSSKKGCVKKCAKPPIDCYTCFINPGEQRGKCILTHPVKTGTNEPVDKCEDSPNTFSTAKECQKACVQKGPVNPVAKCWAVQDSETCKCTYGEAVGPDGPLQSCSPSEGFYNTKEKCVQTCKGEHSTSVKIWIILGVITGVLLLLFVVGVILYFLWKRKQK